jgi:hypothetical protein
MTFQTFILTVQSKLDPLAFSCFQESEINLADFDETILKNTNEFQLGYQIQQSNQGLVRLNELTQQNNIAVLRGILLARQLKSTSGMMSLAMLAYKSTHIKDAHSACHKVLNTSKQLVRFYHEKHQTNVDYLSVQDTKFVYSWQSYLCIVNSIVARHYYDLIITKTDELSKVVHCR